MLISPLDLTMTTSWVEVETVAETGDLVEKAPVKLKTWIMENKILYIQNSTGYSAIPAKGYILAKDTKVKRGDKLDGVFVQKINIINDFDGSVDHVEAYTY